MTKQRVSAENSDDENAGLMMNKNEDGDIEKAPAKAPADNDDTTPKSAWIAVSGYMLTSALLLVVNKLAVNYFPHPSILLFSQLFAAAAFTWALGMCNFIDVDALEWAKVKAFWIVPVSFLGTIFANIKILQHANVETFIVFRASTPLVLSVLETHYLGRDLPTKQSVFILIVLLLGALSYMQAEQSQLTYDSMFWVVVWFTLFCFDQIYIKHVVNTVEMTTWGRVYYTNLIPLPFLVVIGAFTGEVSGFMQAMDNVFTVNTMWVPLSWVLGTGISFFAFWTRKALSATSFTVVGNASKACTVLVNVLVWDKHASPGGIGALFVCLVAAYFYKPSPMLTSDAEKAKKRRWTRAILAIVITAGLAGLALFQRNSLEQVTQAPTQAPTLPPSSTEAPTATRDPLMPAIYDPYPPLPANIHAHDTIVSALEPILHGSGDNSWYEEECAPLGDNLTVPRLTTPQWLVDILLAAVVKPPFRMDEEASATLYYEPIEQIQYKDPQTVKAFNTNPTMLPIEIADQPDVKYVSVYRRITTIARTAHIRQLYDSHMRPVGEPCQLFNAPLDPRLFEYKGQPILYTHGKNITTGRWEPWLMNLATNKAVVIDIPDLPFPVVNAGNGKNYGFFSFNEELYFIHSSTPLTVLKLDEDLLISFSKPSPTPASSGIHPRVSCSPAILSASSNQFLRGGTSGHIVLGRFVWGIGHVTRWNGIEGQIPYLWVFDMHEALKSDATEDTKSLRVIELRLKPDFREANQQITIFPVTIHAENGHVFFMATESDTHWGKEKFNKPPLSVARNMRYQLY